jgi:hypothetical protein
LANYRAQRTLGDFLVISGNEAPIGWHDLA